MMPVAKTDRHVLLSVLLAAAGLLAILITTSRDFTARGDVRSDVVFRDAAPPGTLSEYRFADTSPFAIWLPSDLHVARSLRNGQLPLWNRLQGGGSSPLLAYQNGVLHPLRWIVALLPLTHVEAGLIVLSVALAFAGMYLLIRQRLGCGAAPAVSGALIFVFSGCAVSMLHFTGFYLPLAHVGWILYFYSRWRENGSRTTLMAYAVTIALLLLAGHPAGVFTVALTTMVVVAGDCLTDRSARPLLGSAAASVAGALLASPAILPVVLGAADVWTYKTETTHGMAFEVFPWARWRETVAGVFVDRRLESQIVESDPYYAFLGPAAVLLVAVGVFRLFRQSFGRIVLTLLAMGFVLGFPSPAWSFVRFIPGVPYLKSWYLLPMLIVAVSIAAAEGSEQLLKRSRRYAFVIIAIALAPLVWRFAAQLRIYDVRTLDDSAVREIRRVAAGSRVTGSFGQTHLPNLSELTGVEDVRVSAPLLSRRYREFMEVVAPGCSRRSFPTTLVADRFDSAYLYRFGVSHVIVSRIPGEAMHTPLTPGYRMRRPVLPFDYAALPGREVAVSRPSFDLFEVNGGAIGRAYFATAVRFVDDIDSSRVLMMAHRVRGFPATIVEGRGATPAAAPARQVLRVSFPSDNEVVIDCGDGAAGWLVLRDSWDRGWSAKIAGRSVDVRPADLLSRAVLVPAGPQIVRMRYRPFGFAGGCAVAAATAAILALYVARGHRAT